jgi:transcriptional regulator with XRE-family HTH domain
MSNIKRIFGQNLRRLRDKSGADQGEFAAKLGFKQSYLSGLEKGRIGFTSKSVNTICEKIGCTPAELFYVAPENHQEVVPIIDDRPSLEECAAVMLAFERAKPADRQKVFSLLGLSRQQDASSLVRRAFESLRLGESLKQKQDKK